MALFGLNWEESKWPGHFCSIVLYFFASKIVVKLPPEKKVPWHRRGAVRCRGWNSHFCQKNAFFGQKMTFFKKVHFIQKWSVTKNTFFGKVHFIQKWSVTQNTVLYVSNFFVCCLIKIKVYIFHHSQPSHAECRGSEPSIGDCSHCDCEIVGWWVI